MSSEHEHQVEESWTAFRRAFREDWRRSSSVEESRSSRRKIAGARDGPIPFWLIWLIGLGLFWAGAYLFSFSGGFKADVFDFEPKFGVQGAARRVAPGSEGGRESPLFSELHYLPSG